MFGDKVSGFVGCWLRQNIRHPQFTGIANDMPLKISQKSHIAPFNAIDYKIAIEENGMYTCGINLFWANPFFSACPGVPINRAGVRTSDQHCVMQQILVTVMPSAGHA